MDDIWIISWFNHTAFDANPIWKSPKRVIYIRGTMFFIVFVDQSLLTIFPRKRLRIPRKLCG